MKKYKNFIKKAIKKIIPKKIIYKIDCSKKIYNMTYGKNKNKSLLAISRCFGKVKIYDCKNSGKSIKKLLKKVSLNDINGSKFYYSIDIYKSVCSNLSNISIDYSKILDNSIEDYKKIVEENKSDEKFYKNELDTLQGIEILIDRIILKLKKENIDDKIINNFNNIKTSKTLTFYEALQRILFFNQLLWQTGHRLNGLGRLDMILYPYYKNDIEKDMITEQDARKIVKEFIIMLHEFYEFKSNALLGDTGQIIEIGGKDANGIYQYNELTFMFIDLMEEVQLPDPKVLLRVSSDTPRELIEESLKCIKTGVGYPLFANDDVIIEKLIKFGYKKADAYNYGTSACWEPYIIGKSLDQNNVNLIIFLKPFEKMLNEVELDKIDNVDKLLNTYKKYLKEHIENVVDQTQKNRWLKDPLLSLLIDNCIETNKDISDGGAIYNNYGVLSVGLANLINSIVNIEKFVFKDKKFTFSQINEIRKNNFKDNEILLKNLKDNTDKYGIDNERIIKLTNDIIIYTTSILKEYTNYLGGKYKFGLSAPNYITAASDFPASFDGRKRGEPFAVHISSDTSNAYTELIQFASKLDYGENRFNGNVVDFMVSPEFIENNFGKFVDFLMLSVKAGFFEMQMNVVSSKTLLEARKNPEKFPNLIVRVWGFSAYFKDLPDSYKDNLIERALKSEGISR